MKKLLRPRQQSSFRSGTRESDNKSGTTRKSEKRAENCVINIKHKHRTIRKTRSRRVVAFFSSPSLSFNCYRFLNNFPVHFRHLSQGGRKILSAFCVAPEEIVLEAHLHDNLQRFTTSHRSTVGNLTPRRQSTSTRAHISLIEAIDRRVSDERNLGNHVV